MSRPAVVYLVMIVALVTGLWAVLGIGRHLQAPEDLAGKWQLTPIPGDGPAEGLTIEQSGRFFQIVFEHNPGVGGEGAADNGQASLDLELQPNSASTLVNKKWTLNVQPKGTNPDDKLMVLTGPRSVQWNAHRTVRTFPADVDAKEAK